MAERKRGLGRGLGALIPSAPVEKPSSESNDRSVGEEAADAPQVGSATAPLKSTGGTDTAAAASSRATDGKGSHTELPEQAQDEPAESASTASKTQDSSMDDSR